MGWDDILVWSSVWEWINWCEPLLPKLIGDAPESWPFHCYELKVNGFHSVTVPIIFLPTEQNFGEMLSWYMFLVSYASLLSLIFVNVMSRGIYTLSRSCFTCMVALI